MDDREYLESLFKRAFERELDVDENVSRTLPFFATTLALVATLYGYATTQLPRLEWRPMVIALHGLLVTGGLFMGLAVLSLLNVVRAREYRIPPKETEQLAWADQLRTFHQTNGMSGAALDEQVLTDLRERMIVEYAEGAEHNRLANIPKLKARSLGFTRLVISLGIVFLMIAIMFTTDRIASVNPMRGSHDSPAKQGAGTAGTSGDAPAAAAKAAGPPSGREIPRSAGGQHGEQQMSDGSQKSPAQQSGGQGSQPSQSAPAPAERPAPPSHQTLKKSEGGDFERR